MERWHPPRPSPAALPKRFYTSWIARCAAFVIDALPVGAALTIANSVAVGTADTQCVEYSAGGVACAQGHSTTGIVTAWVMGLLSLAYVVWNHGYRQGRTGSSIGKSLLRFRVVSEKTWQPIGFGRSVLRQLAHLVDCVVCFLGYLLPLWDGQRQTIADKMMTTVCVPTGTR
ncbi:RDD family protein [Mycobacterium sp. SMC-4]|uniref:RDD family protein n=1 Tax=Mycobacterium sp. SMC-4 TaxID=2857059 RepID=UPI003D04156C